MGAIKGGKRRKHSDEFKASVVAACGQRGASVAGVARAHQLNANLVSIWIRQASSRLGEGLGAAPATQEFVELQLAPKRQTVESSVRQDIRVELRRGDTTVTVAWPLEAAGDCGAWLKQWLR